MAKKQLELLKNTHQSSFKSSRPGNSQNSFKFRLTATETGKVGPNSMQPEFEEHEPDENDFFDHMLTENDLDDLLLAEDDARN